jgi:hypothetical protein
LFIFCSDILARLKAFNNAIIFLKAFLTKDIRNHGHVSVHKTPLQKETNLNSSDFWDFFLNGVNGQLGFSNFQGK